MKIGMNFRNLVRRLAEQECGPFSSIRTLTLTCRNLKLYKAKPTFVYIMANQIVPLVSYTSDENLIGLLNKEFTTENQQQFLLNFQLYLQYGDDNTHYVIDLDDAWIWLGFSRKDKAKRTLVNNFEQETDYIITLPRAGERTGGQNKEQIMMNIETFKNMCMLSNTEKGKQTRKYYVKMESIFFKHLREQNNQLRLTINTFEYHKELEIQQRLIKAYHKTPVIYIARIKKNGYVIFIKIGETDDIGTRIGLLKAEYPEIMLLDVYACDRPHLFEQHIIHNKVFAEHYHTTNETFKLTDTFNLKYIQSYIKKNIYRFCGIVALQKRYDIIKTEERIQIMKNLEKATDPAEKELYMTLLKNQDVKTDVKELDDSDNDDEKPFRQRSVFKYSPDNLRDPIETFGSLRQAARSLNNPQYHDYHIRNASIHSTVFDGYRWFFTDDGEERPEEIPPTKTEEGDTSSKRHKGLIVQINKEKTKILNVFASQRDAEKETKVPNCQISSGISTGRIRQGFYWNLYDNCTEELKSTFEGTLPEQQRVATCSKKVQRIDPLTNTVLETYPCIQDVCNAFSCCHKSIKQASATGNIFKNFVWKIGE